MYIYSQGWTNHKFISQTTNVWLPGNLQAKKCQLTYNLLMYGEIVSLVSALVQTKTWLLFSLNYVSNVTHHSCAHDKKLASCWPMLCIVRKIKKKYSFLFFACCASRSYMICSTQSSSPLSMWARGENVCCLITERLTKIASWEMEKK